MTERKRLRIIPILITMAVALLLAIGSFYGCSRTFMHGSQDRLSMIFFWSFFFCAGCFLGSIIWLLVTLALNYFGRLKDGL